MAIIKSSMLVHPCTNASGAQYLNEMLLEIWIFLHYLQRRHVNLGDTAVLQVA
jgi:hypothetical protein